MSKKRKESERLAEELMAAFGKELGKARADFCEALMDPDREDPPMFIEESRWNNSMTGSERNLEEKKVIPIAFRSKGRIRRVSVLVAAAIMVMGLAMVAEGIKLDKSTVTMEETPKESVKLFDLDKGIYDVEDFNVTFIPEGYELIRDEVVSESMRWISYKDVNGNGIQINISKTDTFGANVDNERTTGETILVNDHEGHFFKSDRNNMIVWQIGDCTLDITGQLSKEEMVDVAKQIFLK